MFYRYTNDIGLLMSVSIFLSFFFFRIFVSYFKRKSYSSSFLNFFLINVPSMREAIICIKRSVANYIRTQSFHVKAASVETTIPRRRSATFIVKTVSITSWAQRELKFLQKCISCLLDSDKTVGACTCVRLQYKKVRCRGQNSQLQVR